jgi:hypothetical protein
MAMTTKTVTNISKGTMVAAPAVQKGVGQAIKNWTTQSYKNVFQQM